MALAIKRKMMCAIIDLNTDEYTNQRTSGRNIYDTVCKRGKLNKEDELAFSGNTNLAKLY